MKHDFVLVMITRKILNRLYIHVQSVKFGIAQVLVISPIAIKIAPKVCYTKSCPKYRTSFQLSYTQLSFQLSYTQSDCPEYFGSSWEWRIAMRLVTACSAWNLLIKKHFLFHIITKFLWGLKLRIFARSSFMRI